MNFSIKPHFISILRLVAVVIIVAGLAGCSEMKTAHLSDNVNPDQMAQKNESEKLWRDNKDWLLSNLPKTELIVQDIVSILQETPDSENSCSDPSSPGCDKLLNLLRQKLSKYRLVQLPNESGYLAIMNGDAAYVFRISDWTFSGIANLSRSLYFTVQDAPLRRTDSRSFAFVDDDKSDTTTLWTIYRRNIL